MDFGGLAPEVDSVRMYSGSAFTATPSPTDSVGVVSHIGGDSQAPLSQLITTLVQRLASPSSSASSDSVLAGLLSDLLTMSSSPSSTTSARLFGGISGGSVLQALLSDYRYFPGFFGLVVAIEPAVAKARTPAVGNAAAVEYGGA